MISSQAQRFNRFAGQMGAAVRFLGPPAFEPPRRVRGPAPRPLPLITPRPTSRTGQLGGPPLSLPYDPNLDPLLGYDPSLDSTISYSGGYGGYSTPGYNPASTVAIGASTPIYSPATSGNTFNTISALISQGLQAIAPHPSNQIVPNGGGLQIVANPGVQQSQAAAAAQIANANRLGSTQYGSTAAGGVGGGLGQGLDGIISWATANPIPVFLLIGGAFLLFRDPPRSRR